MVKYRYMKIGLFDSGIGGTTILEAIKKLLPDEEYKYIADTKNCPYGEKTDSELREIVSNRARELADWGAEIIVVACNTATTGYINYLRKQFPNIDFVGTEPAIKVATDSGAKNILVLATPNTILSSRTHDLIKRNQKPGQHIELLACPGLADIIEKYGPAYDHEPIIDFLQETFSHIDKNGVDTIVLGCTHYPLIKDDIRFFFPHAKFVDSSDGVARRVKSLVDGLKILLLGYGKEGQSAEKYLKSHFKNVKIDILENFNINELKTRDFANYDLIFRSPSVPPLGLKNETSVTKYFFDHCPCPIIGVTATKGKGTTCSFIKSLLDALGENAYLVGNIGTPSIDVLDNLKPSDVVVYEMSSFQLWDLKTSPHVAVVGTIEPDHLNVHNGFDDYVGAKTNICRYQTADDFLIYYQDNPDSVKIASHSPAQKISFPFELPDDIRAAVKLPGEHNIRNAMAAIAAVAAYKNLSPDSFIADFKSEIIQGLSNFHGLPHRLEFVRELNNVRYYDDNFSTNPSSTRVAIEAFPDDNVIIIVGGRDKTDNTDLPEIYDILKSQNLKKIILLGESGHELAKNYSDPRFILVESLEDAIKTAQAEAEKFDSAIVLMSPSAASFDMFENVYDRGNQYKLLIVNL